MKKFYLSSDSTCDLFADEVKALDIGFLPLTLSVEEGGQTNFFPDCFQKPEEYCEFFNKLRKGVKIRTSMNNLQIHYEYFLSLAQAGHKNILHITISYALAPTRDVAETAVKDVKKLFPDFNCRVVESHTTTYGQGLLVQIAAKMRDEGATAEQTGDYLDRIKYNIQHFLVVEDLQHLKRGGRISGAAAAIGAIAQLKILITFDREGRLQVYKKVLGGSKKAIKAIFDEYKNYHPAEPNSYLTVMHSDNQPCADEIVKCFKETYGITPAVRTVGPTIGCHLGPGAYAFLFLSTDERPDVGKNS